MANINVSWTALANTVTDVDSLEVYKSSTLSNEAAFKTALDAYFSDPSSNPLDTSFGTGLTQVATGLAYNASNLGTTPDTVAAGTGDVYYCVAAKNAGGYKIGSEAPDSELTTVPDATTPSQGAVGFVNVA